VTAGRSPTSSPRRDPIEHFAVLHYRRSETLATATVDRLLHHAHLCDTTGGESVRLAQAMASKGVLALSESERRPNLKGVSRRAN
jgi:hypothetical protein